MKLALAPITLPFLHLPRTFKLDSLFIVTREIFEADPSLATGFDESGALESYEHSKDLVNEIDDDASGIELSKEDEDTLLDAMGDIELDELDGIDEENTLEHENEDDKD